MNGAIELAKFAVIRWRRKKRKFRTKLLSFHQGEKGKKFASRLIFDESYS